MIHRWVTDSKLAESQFCDGFIISTLRSSIFSKCLHLAINFDFGFVESSPI